MKYMKYEDLITIVIIVFIPSFCVNILCIYKICNLNQVLEWLKLDIENIEASLEEIKYLISSYPKSRIIEI